MSARCKMQRARSVSLTFIPALVRSVVVLFTVNTGRSLFGAVPGQMVRAATCVT